MARRIQDVPAPRIAAIYCRVSSRQQSTEDKVSLETQEAEARAWCAAHGWTVTDAYVYREVHSGEDLWERRVLQQLLEDAKTRPFGLVLSHSVDRLSRDKTAVHLGIITDQLERAGVAFDFTTESFESTPLGFLTMQIRGFAAGIENERKRERIMRANRAKAISGKLIPGPWPLYGYQWGPERTPLGKLTKARLVIDPVTSRVVQRIYADALAGKTLRGIATALTAEGIPTPTGRSARWSAMTVRLILRHPAYAGQPAALRHQYVPVEKHLRAQYAQKHRRIARPLEEQIPMADGVIPPLVPAEYAQRVAERLTFNQRAAVRNARHPERTLLRGGFAFCGYCGYRLAAVSWTHDDRLDARYYCQAVSCAHRRQAIEAHLLDAAVWGRVAGLLRDPDLIRREVAQMQAAEAPGTDALAVIDERIAGIARRLANVRRLAEHVDDPDQTAQLAKDIGALVADKRSAEAERVAAQAHFGDWHEQQAGLQQTLDWCGRVGHNLDTLTYDEKRAHLAALRVRVTLYRAGHNPRAGLEVRLPLSGIQTLEGISASSDCVDMHSCSSTQSLALRLSLEMA